MVKVFRADCEIGSHQSEEGLPPMQLASCLHRETLESILGRDKSICISDDQYDGRTKYSRAANLFEEEKCDKPSNNRVTGRSSAREKVRVLLQETVVAEQFREPVRRAGECSSDNGPVPCPQSSTNKVSSIFSNKLWESESPTL